MGIWLIWLYVVDDEEEVDKTFTSLSSLFSHYILVTIPHYDVHGYGFATVVYAQQIPGFGCVSLRNYRL